MKRMLMFFCAMLTALSSHAFSANGAQFESPVTWTFSAKTINKSEAVLLMKARLKPTWHLFSLHMKSGGPAPTAFSFTRSKEYEMLGAMVEPKPISYYEKLFKMDVQYFEKEVEFQQRVKLNKAGATIGGKVEFMVCNPKECLPPDELEFSINTR